jgi:hypothetical protein
VFFGLVRGLKKELNEKERKFVKSFEKEKRRDQNLKC